jgi:hypothetical protein
MSNVFLRSLFVRPPIVLDRQLLPLSAFHLATLTLLKSPFIMGGTPTEDDVAMAVFVCSHSSRDLPDLLFPEIDAVAFSECCPWHEVIWALELADLQQYFNDYLEFPIIAVPVDETGKANSKASAVPMPFKIVASILQFMSGIEDDDAWDKPINKLVCYKSAVAEEHGWEVQDERQTGLINSVLELNKLFKPIGKVNTTGE